MNELSKLYDRSVLSRKESCILGKIVNVFFDKKCQNIAYFVVLPNISSLFDRQSLLVVAFEDVLAFNDVLVIESMLYASNISNVDTSSLLGEMIDKNIYTQSGKQKGCFIDVIVNDKGKVLRLMSKEKSYSPSAFWNIGEVAFLNASSSLKHSQPKQMPKTTRDTLVTILDDSRYVKDLAKVDDSRNDKIFAMVDDSRNDKNMNSFDLLSDDFQNFEDESQCDIAMTNGKEKCGIKQSNDKEKCDIKPSNDKEKSDIKPSDDKTQSDITKLDNNELAFTNKPINSMTELPTVVVIPIDEIAAIPNVVVIPTAEIIPSVETAEIPTVVVIPSVETAELPTVSVIPSGEPAEIPTVVVIPSVETAELPTVSVNPRVEPAEIPTVVVIPSVETAELPTIKADTVVRKTVLSPEKVTTIPTKPFADINPTAATPTTQVANSPIAATPTTQVANSPIAATPTTQTANSAVADKLTTPITEIPVIRIKQREPLFAKDIFNSNNKKGDVAITSFAYSSSTGTAPTTYTASKDGIVSSTTALSDCAASITPADSSECIENTDCHSNENADCHTPARIICEYDFLLGRRLMSDLKSYIGELLAPEGDIVDVEIVEKARKCGKLVDLTLSSK